MTEKKICITMEEDDEVIIFRCKNTPVVTKIKKAGTHLVTTDGTRTEETRKIINAILWPYAKITKKWDVEIKTTEFPFVTTIPFEDGNII